MAIADDINEIIDSVVDDFRFDMLLLGERAWNKIKPQLDNLETDEGSDRLKVSPFNTTTKTDMALDLLEQVQSQEYTESIQKMQSALEPMHDLVQEFYEDKFGFEAPYQVSRLGKGLVTSTFNTLNAELGQAGFEQSVINPAINAFQGYIDSRSHKDTLIRNIEPRITDRIKTFTDIKATTIMQQFGRRLNDLYGRIGARKARYSGPQDDVNRDFCAQKVGKVFTVEEIQAWVPNQAPWDGMIPNTDRGSIFVNLGGWNCRHVLEWEDE